MKVTEYYCDRCRRQIPLEQLVSNVNGVLHIVGDAPKPIRKELCDTCMVQLAKWLETLPSEETK